MSYNITVTANQLSVTDATESTPLVTIRKPTSGGSDVTVDTALSTSSYNAIANAPVATALAEKAITYYFSTQSDFITKVTAMPLHTSGTFLMANSTAQALGFSYTAKGTITKTTSAICDLVVMDGTANFFVCRYTISTGTMTINEITGADITVDSALNSTSTNPVQNRAITTELNSVNASLTDLEGDISDVADDVSALQATVTGLSQSTPVAVSTAAEMTDTSLIYLYTGSETGYTEGDLYAYINSAWTDIGTYGTGTISTNARNLLIALLKKVVYFEDAEAYITALDRALMTGDEPAASYTVMYVLTGATSSNTDTAVTENASYSTTLTADSGYLFDSVTVTMGGTDITSTAYTRSTGAVSIATVTGDVVITVTASIPTIMLTAGTHTFTDSTYPGSITIAMDNEGATISIARTKYGNSGTNHFNFDLDENDTSVASVSNLGSKTTEIIAFSEGDVLNTTFELEEYTYTTSGPSNYGLAFALTNSDMTKMYFPTMASGALGLMPGTTYTATKTLDESSVLSVGAIGVIFVNKYATAMTFKVKMYRNGARLF